MAILAGACFSIPSLAQIALSGKVINAQTGEPIAGANVRLEQTTIGCATNDKGEFSIKNVPNGSYVLRASRLDYTTATQKVSKSDPKIVFKLEDAFINLDQVVVTGTGTHHKLKNSPTPIEVISSTELKKAGITDFPSAMNMLNPSFNFSTNAMGSYMIMNGLGNKYIMILVNGKKLAGDISGNTDLSRIDMSRIKRIEVLKGAASSLYGSEAIAGVINIITDQPKNLLNVSSNTRYAGHNQFTQSANVDVTAGKFGSYTSYQRQQTDGWQLNSTEEVKDKKGNITYEPTDKQASNKFFSNTVNQMFTYNPNRNLSLYAQGGFYNKETDRPVTEYTYNMAYQDYNLSVGGKYLLGNSSYISLDLYNDNFESSKNYIQEDKKNDIKVGESVLSKRQHYYNANLKGVFKAGQYNKLTVGTEYVGDRLKNPEALSEDKSVYTLSVYGQDEFKWNKLQAILGLRYVYHEAFKNRVTPKASLMYSLGDFNFRASYAAGFRAPSLEQLYYNKIKTAMGKNTLSIGDPNLKPEKSNYYALNAEYVSGRLTASVSAYTNTIADMINTVEETPNEQQAAEGIDKVNRYVNIDKARVKGVDVSLNSYIGGGFSVAAGYSYADARDTKTHQQLERSIRHTGNITGNWVKSWKDYRLNVNLNGRLQGERFHISGNAPKYTLWNLNTLHTFDNLGAFILEPGVGIENIFNYRDDRPFGVNYATLSPGRTFYVSLSVKFKK